MSEKISIVLDSSAIVTFLTCPMQWHYKFQRQKRLVFTGKEKPDLPMDMGTAMHMLLEKYYASKETNCFARGEAAIASNFTPEIIEKLSAKAVTFLTKRFREYVLFYREEDYIPLDRDKSIEVGFSYLLHETETHRYILTGRIDLIAGPADNMVLIDHKTQGKYGQLYGFRPQFLTYSLVSGISKVSVNYIGLQAERTDRTFHRQLIVMQPYMLDAWKKKVISIFDTIATGNTPEKNQASCGGAYDQFPCQYTPLCELPDEASEMRENLLNFKYETVIWEPWTLEKTEEK